jgi:DNA repair protein RecO
MHPVVVTEGIVLLKRNVGEANTVISVLTETHGLIRAKAASTRAEKSKLRFGLEPLTLATFSFVEGRHEWKLVGVEGVAKVGGNKAPKSRASLGRVIKLISRLVQGEERVPKLFEDTKIGLHSLAEASSEAELQSIECVLVLRILSDLGYLPQEEKLQPFLASVEYPQELTHKAHASRSYLIRMINDSLSHTGL